MDKKPLPDIGKKYHFFDDGKVTPSRHNVAEIVSYIPFSEFGNVKYTDLLSKEEAENYRPDDGQVDPTLLDIWKMEVDWATWLYAPETDYAVKTSIPNYDKNPIFFVRTKDGGWFSIDTVSGWESGRLDIDGTRFESLKEDFKEFYEKHKNDIY